ncbi:hypothetical protein LguiA_011514 [Lonicera macranthoides]
MAKKLVAVFIIMCLVVSAVNVKANENDDNKVEDYETCYKKCGPECEDKGQGIRFHMCDLNCEGGCIFDQIKAKVHELLH